MAQKAGRKGLLAKLVDGRGRLRAEAGGITPEQVAKIERALLTPVSTLPEKQLAGVGTGKDQIMTKVGNGLKLSGATSPFTLGLDAPAFTSADAGKALTVADDGSLEWAESGAGGGYLTYADLERLTGLGFISSSSKFTTNPAGVYYLYDLGDDFADKVIFIVGRNIASSSSYCGFISELPAKDLVASYSRSISTTYSNLMGYVFNPSSRYFFFIRSDGDPGTIWDKFRLYIMEDYYGS